MSTWDTVDHYYSGQGVVLLAKRNVDGSPMGLAPIGNVSNLKLSVSTSVLEHKESHTGQRSVDLRLTTETKCALSMTVENFIAQNLADSLRGDVIAIPPSSVVDEKVVGYKGAVSALAHLGASAVVVATDVAVPVTLTAFPGVLGKWDYKVNLAAGSLQLNGDAASWDALTAGAFDVNGKCPLLVDYTYVAQSQVDALTQGAGELYMRFEGLNTADGNKSVVVEVFKFVTDPLKELSLIADTVQQFVLEGSVLSDSTRIDGSKYFTVTQLG